MSGLDCEAGNCLPGSDSVWFLIALLLIWAAVAALTVTWGVVCWRERQQEHTGYSPSHRPARGAQLRSALSVEEIRRWLAAEAAQPPPPVRRITIVPRTTCPAPPLVQSTGSATEPFDPFGNPDDDDREDEQ